MTDFADAKHRPHGIHTGEVPENPITYGPDSLRVTLDRWGPTENLFTSMYDALQANWGDAPSRTVHRDVPNHPRCDNRVTDSEMSFATGWYKLTDNERDYIESCFAGKTLQQVLEGVTFDFCIDGVARAFTHQNVRTRLGAGFMQHGGRDNDWRHRPWTMPETISRMCTADDLLKTPSSDTRTSFVSRDGLRTCIVDWAAIDRYVNDVYAPSVDACSTDVVSIRQAIDDHLMHTRLLYAALVDAGIPWQDARRVLPIGMQTYIHDQYNYLALAGVLANRLEHIMDWEFNCVAQLMLREIKMKCPPLISKYLGSHSDKAGRAKFAALESWPPDRKYPSPYDNCKLCGHPGSNHKVYPDRYGEMICQVCYEEGSSLGPMHKFEPVDTLERQHRPEQNPFFVLHPNSMAGGPIVWIPTNGQYPHDLITK